MMIGTLINTAAILIGSLLGLLFGKKLPERMSDTVIAGMGFFIIALGVSMFLETTRTIITLVSLVLGGVLGEWWQIEDGLIAIGLRLEARFGTGEPQGQDGNRFIRGFLTASLLYCIGPLAILGSIQDGLLGDFTLLSTKAIIDGFASIAFASIFGIGVIFSAGMVFLYQTGLTLMAVQAQALFSESMIMELSAVGGILLMALGTSNLLDLKRIRTANLLPALVIAPLLAWAIHAIGAG